MNEAEGSVIRLAKSTSEEILKQLTDGELPSREVLRRRGEALASLCSGPTQAVPAEPKDLEELLRLDAEIEVAAQCFRQRVAAQFNQLGRQAVVQNFRAPNTPSRPRLSFIA